MTDDPREIRRAILAGEVLNAECVCAHCKCRPVRHDLGTVRCAVCAQLPSEVTL
jgi:uncharacterized Zn finger protein (UPF0148 family)